MTTVRTYTGADWPRVWPIVRDVVRAADTFAHDPAMTEDQAHTSWVTGRTTVAVDGDDVLGTAHMHPNRDGPGDHVATASYMVATAARGRGVATALCADSLRWARDAGFAGMQFNAVVETNAAAVRIYRRFGFEIVGTVPGAFRHPTAGRVGLHVMYCALDPPTR